MKKLLGAGLCALTGMALPGCVTINIYFPAAAAEKAADKIIGEVWQLKKPGVEGQGGQGGQGADKPRTPEPATEPAVQPQQPLQPKQ
ncbi:MAG TPA: hypothetical protein VGP12_10265 [Nitrosospira sp.]|jgi:hypothetical protein|nr:hypothetical protein [Nitrosospira sp.]